MPDTQKKERMKRKELFEMVNEILGNKLEIKLYNDSYKHHYKTTTYSFTPKMSKKLIIFYNKNTWILKQIK